MLLDPRVTLKMFGKRLNRVYKSKPKILKSNIKVV